MTQLATLDQKEKGLVAVGASVAAGCQPCTSHYFRQARLAKASDDEICQAVDAALCVRDSGGKVMARHAERLLGREEAAEACCPARTAFGELVCVAASHAINCVDNLEKHLTQARAAGATERQIVMALSIARSVKAAAASKVEAVVQVASDKASGENMYCEAKPIVVGGARQTSDRPPLGSTRAGQPLCADAACSCSATAE